MSDAHRNAFVAESEEGITELNNALLALERDPEDNEAMDSIFRTAHTLKGNGAAMGYDSISELAHELEDLLDEVRAENIEVSVELMDLLFDGVDYLDAMVEDIKNHGETDIDASNVENELRELIENGGVPDSRSDSSSEPEANVEPEVEQSSTGTVSGEETDNGSSGGSDSEVVGEFVTNTGSVNTVPDEVSEVVLEEGESVYQADVLIGESAMKGIDAVFALQSVEEQYPSYVSVPDEDAIENGEFEDSFTVFVIDDGTISEVEHGLNNVKKASDVSVSQVTGISEGEEKVADLLEEPVEDSVGGVSEQDRRSDDVDNSKSSKSDTKKTDENDEGDDKKKVKKSRSDSKDIASVRVDVAQLDELYTYVEQLVTSRIKLRREMTEAGIDSENLDELDKITASLQNTAMDMRLIPLSKVIDTFPRLVRDVARDTGKKVNYEVTGKDIELDRTILTEIRDPLIHILRNAIDHGVEPPSVREENGKDPVGRVSLTATRERDHVTIEVSDDGGGLDTEMLKEKALENSVKTESELEMMDDSEIYELIFHPGFSTADEVTDVSGRGVGMDVVSNTVKKLDGSVSVDSGLGEGTTVTLRLPVTVAIVKVMFIEVAGTEYGIPIKNIAEVTRTNDIKVTNGEELIEHDDDIYKVLRLAEELDEDTVNRNIDENDGMLLRIRDEKRKVALHCDRVIDQEEVVVKPLEGVLSGIPGLSGTAVLGDGDVVAVLDVVTL